MSQATRLTLGFLSVQTLDDHGQQAGYLLLNELGRPVEFHHTSVLCMDPAERALYGRQWEPYVHAELLGKPLIDRQGTAPRLIAVDSAGLLEIRPSIPAPVVRPRDEQHLAIDTHPRFSQDRAAFEKCLEIVGATFDWREPFQRIADALAQSRESPSLSAVPQRRAA